MRLCLLAICLCAVAAAADWPQWRGPARDGKSAETGLAETWPAGGPPRVWKVQGLGSGYSSIAVAAGRLYTQGQSGSDEYVLALDAATGKQFWKTKTGAAFGNDKGNGPRGTPTVDGSRLYALAADGTLACLDAASGKSIWQLNFVQRFAGQRPTWGYSESPLVEGEHLIVTPGGRGAAVVALNKATGEVIWKSGDDRAGYSSPMSFDVGGSRVLAVLTANAGIGLDAKTGALLWRNDKSINRTANIATPVVDRGHVFYSSDYGTGCALLKVARRASAIGASEVYFNREMRNHYTTSVLVGDYLYGFSSAVLTAMNFMTGKVAWQDRSVGKGNCIYAGNRLYCMGEEGAVALIEPTPEAYRERSRFRIPAGSLPTWTPPTVANGRLYLREQDNLYCFNVKR